jgi:hypothetical protein
MASCFTSFWSVGLVFVIVKAACTIDPLVLAKSVHSFPLFQVLFYAGGDVIKISKLLILLWLTLSDTRPLKFNTPDMKIKLLLTCAFLAVIFFGCTKEGTTGLSSLISLVPEPPGANCSAGGVKVVSGLDGNRDNILEDDEIQNVKYVCNGSTGSSDKQVILYFPANGIAYETSSAAGQIDSIEVINNFDISNYTNADSITFSSYLQTTDPNVSDTLDLYDLTNNTVINNTTLTSNSTSLDWKTTTLNFLTDLPHSPVKLGIRQKSGLEGTIVRYYLPMLTIYKQ